MKLLILQKLTLLLFVQQVIILLNNKTLPSVLTEGKKLKTFGLSHNLYQLLDIYNVAKAKLVRYF